MMVVVAATLLLPLLLLPCAHLLAPHEKRKEREIGKQGQKEKKKEKFVMEAFKKKERGVPRTISSSNFSRKRIGCKSNCSSSRRIGCKSSF
jgi:hypothetical protein